MCLFTRWFVCLLFLVGVNCKNIRSAGKSIDDIFDTKQHKRVPIMIRVAKTKNKRPATTWNWTKFKMFISLDSIFMAYSLVTTQRSSMIHLMNQMLHFLTPNVTKCRAITQSNNSSQLLWNFRQYWLDLFLSFFMQSVLCECHGSKEPRANGSRYTWASTAASKNAKRNKGNLCSKWVPVTNEIKQRNGNEKKQMEMLAKGSVSV